MIGRYVVIERIGQGGTGAVLLAYDPRLARRVAIKVIRTDVVSPHARTRMIREARAMAQLAHPNVVAVYDVGTHGDNVYLTMEYVEGETLASWIETPRSRREVLGVMKQAGRGLAAAHAAGIVHRDFKPSNVVIAKDARVRVLDFGIAFGEPLRDPRPSEVGVANAPTDILQRVRGLGGRAPVANDDSFDPAPASPVIAGERLTEEGAIVGTIGYFAPEAVFDQPSDARADIFSFCVTLWRALTGHFPFPDTSAAAYLDAIFREPRERLRDPRVPEWLAKAIERGLRTDAGDRYASIDELLHALDETEAWKAPIAMAVLALSILAAAGATVGPARRDAEVGRTCHAEADAIATSWSPRARDAVERAMRGEADAFAAERAERTLRRLDDYARVWREEQAASCEATLIAKTQPEEVHEKRTACLIEGRTQLEIVAEILASGDSRAHLRALALASALPSPRLCTAIAAGQSFVALPANASSRAKTVGGRRDVVRARVLVASGSLAVAQGFAEHAIEVARQEGDGGLEASAEHVLGAIFAQRLESDEALRRERRAVARAESVGADHVGGLAAAAAAALLLHAPMREDETGGWEELARAKLARLGTDPILEHAIVRNDVRLAMDSELPRALHANERDLTLARELYGEEDGAYCDVVSQRGVVFRALGDASNAETWARESIACRLRAVGPDDVALASDYAQLATVQAALGQWDDAANTARRALDLLERVAPNDPLRVELWARAAVALDGAGRYDEAEQLAHHAVDVADGSAEDRALAFYGLGLAHAGRGDAEPAKSACARALTLAAVPANSPRASVIDPARCLGEAELRLGDVAAARRHLAQSAAVPRRLTPGDQAVTRFALARALAGGSGTLEPDLDRAQSLARQARDELHGVVRSFPFQRGALEDVERWLADRQGAR